MNEPALAAFANDGKYEETVVGLAALSKVPIDVADRLMAGERPDPVLILCKAAEMDWPTVKSIMTAQAQGKTPSSQSLDAAFANYGRLSPSTAQRVVRFWQVKQNGAPERRRSLQIFRKIRKHDARSSRAALAWYRVLTKPGQAVRQSSARSAVHAKSRDRMKRCSVQPA